MVTEKVKDFVPKQRDAEHGAAILAQEVPAKGSETRRMVEPQGQLRRIHRVQLIARYNVMSCREHAMKLVQDLFQDVHVRNIRKCEGGIEFEDLERTHFVGYSNISGFSYELEN